MQKVLKIIFKSTASTDYIYPFFYVKKMEKKIKVDFLAWDFSPNHLLKNLPKKKYLNYNYYTIWDFLLTNLKLNKNLEKTYYFKRIYFYILNKFIFFVKKNLIKNFLLGYDRIYMDCRELQSLPYQIFFCRLLNSINKTIIFVPHSPYYTNLIRETSDDHALYFKNCKKKLLICTKKSKPWLDTGGFKKSECKYIGLPARNKKWSSFFSKLYKKGNEKKFGFMFRPFDRNFNNFFLNYRKGDKYINSFDENLSFIQIAKKLNSQGYKVSFRLHPSSKEDAFIKFYRSNLKSLNFSFSRNTIHDFFAENKNIISFNSSGLIYGCVYKRKIFLKENKLILHIWKEWPLIKKIFLRFSNTFKNPEEFYKKFNSDKIKRYNCKQTLDLLW